MNVPNNQYFIDLQIHEQSKGSIQWRVECGNPDCQERGILRLLQGLHGLLQPSRCLEHLPLGHLRAAEERHPVRIQQQTLIKLVRILTVDQSFI